MEKCYLLKRRQATIRRNKKKMQGSKLDCKQFRFDQNGETNRESWFLHSKSNGVVFLFPLEDVENWVYPALYSYVKDHLLVTYLPNVEWVQLHINRYYQGIFLQVELPKDLSKKNGGNGVLREIISITKEKLSIVNTRFVPNGALYKSLLIEGEEPKFPMQNKDVLWLAKNKNKTRDNLMVILGNKEKHEVLLLPLPLDIDRISPIIFGKNPTYYRDDRFRGWLQTILNDGDSLKLSFTETQEFKEYFADYSKRFKIAFRSHASVFRTSEINQNLVEEKSRLNNMTIF